MYFWSLKLVWTYYNCLESLIIAHFSLPLFTLALKTKTCVMALLIWHETHSILTISKLSPNLIEITVLYRLPMGSLLGTGASTIIYIKVGHFAKCVHELRWIGPELQSWDDNLAQTEIVTTIFHPSSNRIHPFFLHMHTNQQELMRSMSSHNILNISVRMHI